jgi:hypothetical protein
VAVWVTEGELKAAAGCKLGYPIIGLGGVQSWRSARQGVDFLPELARFTWEGRTTFIVFDSDAATNPHVQRALQDLCAELTALGALPRIVELPNVLGAGVKTGLDDYLLREGKDAFNALCERAEPYELATDLWAFNKEVVLIRQPGVIVKLDDGQRMSRDDFTALHYANRHVTLQSVDAEGNVRAQRKPLADAWLRWPRRFELREFTFDPAEPTITADGRYNIWRGWGVEPRRGDVAPWVALLDFLFKAAPTADRRWFERWCAYPLQHPGTKLYTAAMLWGSSQGTGKSLVGLTLNKIYGAHGTTISSGDLASAFNEWADGRLFVLGDEITGDESRRFVADKLKSLITQTTVRINQKYLPTYIIPDLINYYFTSNHFDAFMLENEDRRYFVHEVVGAPLPQGFYDAYDRWLLSPAGPAALFHHLLSLNLGDFNPRAAAPMTRAKAEMIVENKPPAAAWIHELKTQPDAILKQGNVTITSDLLTSVALMQLYMSQVNDPRMNSTVFGRELKRAQLPAAHGGAPVKVNGAAKRLYIVRNVERWRAAPPRDLAHHVSERFGFKKE